LRFVMNAPVITDLRKENSTIDLAGVSLHETDREREFADLIGTSVNASLNTPRELEVSSSSGATQSTKGGSINDNAALAAEDAAQMIDAEYGGHIDGNKLAALKAATISKVRHAATADHEVKDSSAQTGNTIEADKSEALITENKTEEIAQEIKKPVLQTEREALESQPEALKIAAEKPSFSDTLAAVKAAANDIVHGQSLEAREGSKLAFNPQDAKSLDNDTERNSGPFKISPNDGTKVFRIKAA